MMAKGQLARRPRQQPTDGVYLDYDFDTSPPNSWGRYEAQESRYDRHGDLIGVVVWNSNSKTCGRKITQYRRCGNLIPLQFLNRKRTTKTEQGEVTHAEDYRGYHSLCGSCDPQHKSKFIELN